MMTLTTMLKLYKYTQSIHLRITHLLIPHLQTNVNIAQKGAELQHFKILRDYQQIYIKPCGSFWLLFQPLGRLLPFPIGL